MPRTTRSISLDIAVFICGAVVMVYEIIGSRLVSPYIGNSIYVWTSLIGVILGSLSLGYWLGGRLADKGASLPVLASVIFAAGGLIAVTTLIKEVILSMISAASGVLEIKALAASVLLFAPASVFLGMVTPYAVKLKMLSLDQTGRTVGSLYALSTVGSIVGTFAAGFFLVPFIGSVRTLYMLAASLFAVSVLLAGFSRTRTNIAAVAVFILGIVGSELGRYQAYLANELVDIDTEYSRAQVFVTTEPYRGKRIRAFATDPYFAQSGMYLDSDELAFPYSRYYRLIKHFNPSVRHALMIGGGGFSYPKDYIREFPDASMDVVEIDPMVTDIARKYFRLKDDPRLNICHEDGRAYLNSATNNQYDVVFIDAFGSLFSVPQHITTVEAVHQISRVLNERGIVIVNIGSAITGPASHFMQAELATYQAVFPQVYLFKVISERADTALQNIIIIAAKSTQALTLESEVPEFGDMLSHRIVDFLDTEPILTDDLAPVEYYNSLAQNYFVAGGK